MPIDLLIVFCIPLLASALVSLFNAPSRKEQEACQYHTWAYNHMGIMVCNMCGYLISN